MYAKITVCSVVFTIDIYYDIVDLLVDSCKYSCCNWSNICNVWSLVVGINCALVCFCFRVPWLVPIVYVPSFPASVTNPLTFRNSAHPRSISGIGTITLSPTIAGLNRSGTKHIFYLFSLLQVCITSLCSDCSDLLHSWYIHRFVTSYIGHRTERDFVTIFLANCILNWTLINCLAYRTNIFTLLVTTICITDFDILLQRLICIDFTPVCFNLWTSYFFSITYATFSAILYHFDM